MRRRPTVDVRPRARQDLDEIADYIARDNRAAGRRFYTAAQQTFRQLAAMPGMGSSPEFRNPQFAGIRQWRVRGFTNYLIFYRPTGGGIEVVRVLHAARDIQSIFEAE